MKTFREFIAEDKIGERLGKMSDADFEQFLKGRTPGEEKEFRAKRATYTTSGTAGRGVQDAARQAGQQRTQPPSGGGKPPSGGGKPPAGATPSGGTTSAAPNTSGFRIPRPTRGQAAVGLVNVGLGALDYKQRRDAGQTRVQAGSAAASSAAGGQAGWMTGAKLGTALPIPHPVAKGAAVIGLGLAGSMLGSSGASALSDKLTGVSRQPTEKDYEKARQKIGTTSSRKVAAQSGVYGARSGSAIVGTGEKTPTKTQLPKTMLLPGNKVGDLAYKGGKPVYLTRASVASRDVGLGGVLRNISRTTGIGGQRERDAAATKREYRTALASTQKYYRDIGVRNPSQVTLKPTGNLPARSLPGYGTAPAAKPKPAVKPAVAGGGMGGRRGGGSSPGSIKK